MLDSERAPLSSPAVAGGGGSGQSELSPYVDFDRDEWSALRAATPLTLTETDVDVLRGLNEPFELSEVEEVYLPLTRLLNLRFAATRDLRVVTETFLGHLHAARAVRHRDRRAASPPARARSRALLQAVLGRWPDHPRVDLVTTDGFLFPNAVLEARGLMSRKGFPESYDVRALAHVPRRAQGGRARGARAGVLAPHLRHRSRTTRSCCASPTS